MKIELRQNRIYMISENEAELFQLRHLQKIGEETEIETSAKEIFIKEDQTYRFYLGFNVRFKKK